MGIAVVMLFLVGSTSSERSASKRVNQINKGAGGSNSKKFVSKLSISSSILTE